MELKLINKNNQFLADSREVAEMVEKRHSDLLRDIKGYKEIIDQNANLRSANFFIESAYTNENNQSYLCYLITRKGCDMVANKMTGEKGVLFTAVYVTKFEEMEKAQKPPIQELSPQLQLLINMELEQNKIKQQLNEVNAKADEANKKIEDIKDVITLNPNSWRKDTTAIINKIALNLGGYDHIKDVREEAYRIFDERAGAKLGIRLTNMKKNVLVETGSKSKADKITKVDVIATEKRFIEIFIAIVKEMAIKNGVGKGGNLS